MCYFPAWINPGYSAYSFTHVMSHILLNGGIYITSGHQDAWRSSLNKGTRRRIKAWSSPLYVIDITQWYLSHR